MTETEAKATIEKLHRKYAGVLFDHCFRLLGSTAAAEDALQEVFLSAYRGLASFTYGESHLPWLYRIATNTCFKALRSQRRKGFVLVDDTDLRGGQNPNQDATVHARQILEKLAADLDERGFEIVVGTYFTGMTQDELAKLLGISRRSVVKRLANLRRKVGHLLEEG